ncbi:sigma-70 family RNA polymerase sigma factor [Paeniglutamicibacter antarcticus]|uniref:Sigma-70 family RNA polymerase sigma factor n=1 Tax=Arthrobacter terrae TaxID=2935737 RepID=A0A931G629_9MICC|nr:sigma-70 family RNA polymerase sigma factor [Arthrobacter terrae]MBG0737864.1 sigma-70 family RNA polymerase sigma factor [Arthrobacter terrae]
MNHTEALETFHRARRSVGSLRRALEDELVLGHLDIAETAARAFIIGGRDLDDLRQIASIGLIKAVRGFDPDRGTTFLAYAMPTVRGELKRHLRDSSWVIRPPRHLQDLRTTLSKTAPSLAQRLGGEPTLADLSVELEVDERDVAEALNCQSSLRPESLEAPLGERGDEPTLSLSEVIADSDSWPDRIEEILMLRAAIRKLPARERQLLYRRYFHEESQEQIGRQLAMTQMQVSRLLARVLTKLQRNLQDDPQQEAEGRGQPSRSA